MHTLAVIQARIASTRLPGKVLYALGAYPVLEHVVRRVQASGVDGVVVATTAQAEDAAIAHLCRRLEVDCYRHGGDAADVLGRFVAVAESYNPSVIVRITADCPFTEPTWIDRVVEPLLLCNPATPAFSSNVWWLRDATCKLPDGLDVESFTVGALREADAHETDPEDREHVCHWMHRTLTNVFTATPREDYSHLRWVLDTPEDYAHLSRLVRHTDRPPKPTMDELLRREAS